jgi:hypothetical protein
MSRNFMAAVLATGVLALVISPVNARPRGGRGGGSFRGGGFREFATPKLTSGNTYAYTVRVRTPTSDETRTIRFKANDWWAVDFTKPEPKPKK